MWAKSFKKVKARDAVQKTVASTLLESYKTNKRTPDDFYSELLLNNTTHFTPEELERLLASFKRVTSDRLQATSFYEIVEKEMGWSNLLLRKQLFKAFDFDGHGDINFIEFCEGYSTMLRGTVPELLEFTWRLYHVQGPPDLLSLTDVYTVLRLALAGLDEVRRTQGSAAGGAAEDTRFPERAARQLLESIVGESQAPLTKQEFAEMVLRHRRIADCLIPGFELIPQDPLHRAAEAGEAAECVHLLETDLLSPDGRDGLAFPTTPLHLASRYGHSDVVGVLLARGANARLLNEDGESALHIAVRHGRLRVIELLLEANVDITLRDSRGRTAFHVAAEHGQYKALRLLMPGLELNAVELKDDTGDTPVHLAAAADAWAVIDIFIEFDRFHVTDVDDRDGDGRTPLMRAAQSKAFRVARKLIDLGADVTTTDYSGRSVLGLAVSTSENAAIASMLLADARVDVDLPDDNGRTPLNVCVETEDGKTIRLLLQNNADANIPEAGTGYTPLHKAVIQGWLDGVDALLGPGIECKILRDTKGHTPFDYARHPEIFELLRDYILNLYPTFTYDHPVEFHFGLVFDEGGWELQTEGDAIGARVLKKPYVSKYVASKRVEHKMIDRESIKRQLHKSGLIVIEENVFIQEKVVGLFNGDLRQYTLMRIGAPLHRLQQEAMRMRLQVRRVDFERFEDFYIDEAFYPNLGFEEFSRGEKQKLLLNVIQAVPTNEATLLRGVLQGTAKVAHSSASAWNAARALKPSTAPTVSADAIARAKRREPHVAGISLSHYMKFKVIRDFVVLHDAVQRHNLLQHWRISSLGSREYWRTELLEYFSESKQNEYAALERARSYFGHKISFYLGFLSYFTNWLVAPALAGIVCFGLEFIPSEYDSQITNDTAGDEKFDDQYDHPLMFAFGVFLCLWNTAVVRGWETKSKELAFRWQVDDYQVRNPMPNPLSTAPVRLQYVAGAWAYRAVMTRVQRRNQLKNMLFVSLPIFILFLGLVVAYTWGVFELDDLIERERDFHDNFDDKRLKKKNWKGELALYGATGAQAVVIWLLNTVYDKVAVWCSRRENHETIDLLEHAIAIKVLCFKFCNNYSSLFYYAYYKYDIDSTAAQLASILVVSQLLNNFTEYVVPYLSGAKLATETAEDMVRRLEKTRRSDKSSDPESAEAPKDIGALAADMTKELADENNRLVKQAQAGAGGGAVTNLKETFNEARDEVTMENPSVALEFAEILIQFGFVSMFGAAWPLAALLALLNNFFEVRLDIWKFAKLQRRPVSERVNGIGTFWRVCFEVFCLLGIANHCFLLCVSSNTMREYFFPDITMTERVMAAFCAENFFLLCYALMRIMSLDYIPQWMALKKKEPLRFVRDAYRAGCALRERAYRMMLANPHVTRKQICKNEDIDENAAERYLKIVRYVDGLAYEERKQTLYNSSTTIHAFLTTIMLRVRCAQWVDPLECPTAPGLLRQLVPVTNLRKAYELGKRVRESAYAIWEAHQDVTVMGSRSATVMSIRQFACINAGCTLPQAERYCRLVRYVDRSGGNAFDVLAQLTAAYPRGLMDVLAVIAEEAAPDPGEPVPAELGPHVEPVVYAKRAYERADVIRRKMFERWVLDKHLGTDELIDIVAEDMGAYPPQLHRSLLIKRYCDSLDDRRRKDVLVYAQSGTLALCSNINALIREGAWRDPGEQSFHQYTPPIVVDHTDLEA